MCSVTLLCSGFKGLRAHKNLVAPGNDVGCNKEGSDSASASVCAGPPPPVFNPHCV